MCDNYGHWLSSCPTTAQQNSIQHQSDSVIINVSSLPLKKELDGALDSDPSTAPFADCFMLYSIKDSGPLALELTYSSVHSRLKDCRFFAY